MARNSSSSRWPWSSGWRRIWSGRIRTGRSGCSPDLQQETREALQNLRELARGIYPPLLADLGLVAALESRARKSPVPVAIDADGAGRYAQQVEAAVYFCCLEAMQNVAKYAGASTVHIHLADEAGWLTFSVADDGHGYDSSTTATGSGIQNMADRLSALGGTLNVRSVPGGRHHGHRPNPRRRRVVSAS
jgi:signal transduction histidine kinase